MVRGEHADELRAAAPTGWVATGEDGEVRGFLLARRPREPRRAARGPN